MDLKMEMWDAIPTPSDFSKKFFLDWRETNKKTICQEHHQAVASLDWLQLLKHLSFLLFTLQLKLKLISLLKKSKFYLQPLYRTDIY